MNAIYQKLLQAGKTVLACSFIFFCGFGSGVIDKKISNKSLFVNVDEHVTGVFDITKDIVAKEIYQPISEISSILKEYTFVAEARWMNAISMKQYLGKRSKVIVTALKTNPYVTTFLPGTIPRWLIQQRSDWINTS